MDLEMQVRRRQKVEESGVVVYSAILVSKDRLVRLTVKSKDVDLFQVFKKDAWIPVRIGPDPQKTLPESMAPPGHDQ